MADGVGQETLRLGLTLLGSTVRVIVDRPMGSRHPSARFRYKVNYGYVPAALAPDGDELDAYLLGPSGPVETGVGRCVAVVHREYQDHDKLVVVTGDQDFTDEEILRMVAFQEGHGRHRLVRG
ncbi:MAG TPA: inorganic diphosphatase [Pseudonocardiaceae bacterium]|jgi:inorganic pyrophosphatase|nr:inorganic diphosphatase [Pseudonocardiaceae bacterium]